MPAVALRRSTRAFAPSVRLRPLPDHVDHAVHAPLASPAALFRTASARSPSTGVDGQRPRRGSTEKQTSSAVAPTGSEMTTTVAGGSTDGSPRREGKQ